MTCVYGGAPLKDGGTWDSTTSREVTDRIADRLERFVESDGPKKISTALSAAFELRRKGGG